MENGLVKITDLIPDGMNANSGSEVGRKLLHDSFAEFGAGRSILIDKNNNIIAGNKSASAALENGMREAVVVETEGDTLVVVRRTDVDIDTKKGRGMAIADNAIGANNLKWDESALQAIESKWGVNVKDWGVPKGEFSESDFYHPNLNPGTNVGEVSGDDIKKAEGKVSDQIEAKKTLTNLMDVCCPECGYKFQIKRYE